MRLLKTGRASLPAILKNVSDPGHRTFGWPQPVGWEEGVFGEGPLPWEALKCWTGRKHCCTKGIFHLKEAPQLETLEHRFFKTRDHRSPGRRGIFSTVTG